MKTFPNRKASNDRATQYCIDVIDGIIVAGPHVRDAAQRHMGDLVHAGDRGYYYDEYSASENIAFFEECLLLNSGGYEGKPFLLFPWEAFLIGSIFGWKRESDKTRRFRTAYIETAKGTGKSPIAGGIGIKGLCADGEPRAQIYAAATKRDQAMVVFRNAVAFYEQSPELQKRLTSSGVGEKCWNLAHLESGSFFRVISSEKMGISGLLPHMAILDEIHEHPDGTVIEMLRAGFKSRSQPLAFLITNSGHDMTSICREYHDLGVKIVSPLHPDENDEFFAFICSLDEEDFVGEDGEEDDHYLYDESLWPKVGPSLPYGIPGYEYTRSQVKEAEGLPSKMSTVKRLNFCVWTESENPAISKEVWMACQDKDYPDEILYNRRCWGGLDLSAVKDLTAFALLFEPGYMNMEKVDGVWIDSGSPVFDPYWRIKVWFWVPGIGLRRKVEVDKVPYIVWRDAGYINAINRKTIEYDFVSTDIVDICNTFNPELLAFDRWGKKYFDQAVDRLGLVLPEMVEFGQGYKSMGPAVKIFETKLNEGEFRHDGNPCLTACAANVVADEDPTLAKKYDKKKSTGRIDGIIAIVMGCGIMQDAPNAINIYDDNRLIT